MGDNSREKLGKERKTEMFLMRWMTKAGQRTSEPRRCKCSICMYAEAEAEAEAEGEGGGLDLSI